jgi:hypothetical protein
VTGLTVVLATDPLSKDLAALGLGAVALVALGLGISMARSAWHKYGGPRLAMEWFYAMWLLSGDAVIYGILALQIHGGTDPVAVWGVFVVLWVAFWAVGTFALWAAGRRES